MARRLRIGHGHSWSATPVLNFTVGTPASVNLALSILNPRSFSLTYLVSQGALPSGVTLSGNLVQWSGSGTAGNTPGIAFKAVFGAYSAESALITCQIASIGTATVSWTPPVLNNDGSPLVNLAGHRIYYGTNNPPSQFMQQYPLPAGSPQIISGLTPGTWFFMVRAYDTDGDESDNSNVASKVIT